MKELQSSIEESERGSTIEIGCAETSLQSSIEESERCRTYSDSGVRAVTIAIEESEPVTSANMPPRLRYNRP